jgi:hypothetical protein
VNIISDNKIIELFKEIDQTKLDASKNDRSANVHRLFQYPAMMVPMSQEVVVGVMSKFLPKDALMIDPYMGSATSIIISMKYGLNCYGQDINPLSVLLSKVKTQSFDTNKFLEAHKEIIFQVSKDLSEEVNVKFPNINKWFTLQTQIELSKLRRAIRSFGDLEIRQFFWIVLAETIRMTSNDRTSTYKLHQRPISEIESRNIFPIIEFEKVALRSIDDINHFKNDLEEKGYISNYLFLNKVNICWGDSSKSINTNLKYNLLVSSPPYGDNHTTVTYGQHAYLPLQWIDLIDIDKNIDSSFLRTTQEIDRISLGGRIEKEVIDNKEKLFLKTKTLESFYNSFASDEQKKLYKTIAFINDFDISLDSILEKLDKNAYMIWTIGNRHVAKKELRNDLILRELLENKGIKFISEVEREILNKRMPSRNSISKTMSKEKILIFRKPF